MVSLVFKCTPILERSNKKTHNTFTFTHVMLINTLVYVRVRSSRVIGDFGGYRRLFAYLAPFGREGVGRQCAAKGGCIAL